MPAISPPTVDTGLSQYGGTAAERAILRIASPMKEGKTLIKRNGVWYCKRSPSQRELSDATHVFTGGHIYRISDDLWAEIQADVPAECQPTLVHLGLFPAENLYPANDLFPRSD